MSRLLLVQYSSFDLSCMGYIAAVRFHQSAIDHTVYNTFSSGSYSPSSKNRDARKAHIKHKIIFQLSSAVLLRTSKYHYNETLEALEVTELI